MASWEDEVCSVDPLVLICCGLADLWCVTVDMWVNEVAIGLTAYCPIKEEKLRTFGDCVAEMFTVIIDEIECQESFDLSLQKRAKINGRLNRWSTPHMLQDVTSRFRDDSEVPDKIQAILNKMGALGD